MATKAVWNWFFPKKINLPKCVSNLLEFIYPDVDWDRVTFHAGWPYFLKLSDKAGITLPHFLKPGRIQIYIKQGAWNPCTCNGLGLIVHEGYHVLQMQSLFDGYGLGLLNPSVMLYLACWGNNGFSYDNHPAEVEAYNVAGRPSSLFETCCNMQPSLPCDCNCNPPSVNQAGLQAFNANCLKVVQNSSGISFWKKFEDCTPGHGKYYVPFWLILWFIVSLVLLIVDLVIRIVGVIVSAVVGFVEGLWDVITSPFRRSKGWIWFTTFNGTAWQIPDTPITKNDRSKTSNSPALAAYQSNLYAAYKGKSNNDIWYNIFGGSDWLDEDIKVTKNSRIRTSTSPSLAVYDNKLFMAYKGASNNDIWYSVFDGSNWLDEDIRITKNGRTRTNASPSLAVYDNKLFMAYKGASNNDIWYNVFDGSDWLDEDIRITKNGRTRTNIGPSLAVYNNNLYMVYKGGSNKDIWYNFFDGIDWREEDCRITQNGRVQTATRPVLSELNGLLYMVYRGAS